MKFTNLTIADWRQFSNVDLDFHPSVTIITGANGAGKTTLLKILSQHFGWHQYLLSTPRKKPGSSAFSYFSGVLRKSNKRVIEQNPVPFEKIGSIRYSNGSEASLMVPTNESAAYSVEIQSRGAVDGLNIGSHRPMQHYQAIGAIPTNAINAQQAYQHYFGELLNRHSGGHTQFSPMYRMKETLISMAMFGAGNQYVEKNSDLEKLFLGFKGVLHEILPPSIGFLDVSVRIPDVVLVTRTGEFMIDAASGGLMSLIDLAWQIYLYSQNKTEYTVLLDEPENHLHPSMQRSLLSNLTRAFPFAQFVVATHSPFMVSSVKESIVHALHYKNDEESSVSDGFGRSKVSSIALDLDTRAATANEILRDVLGVPVTLPQWAEDDLKDIISKIDMNNITSNSLIDLRSSLENAGLGEYFPEALKMAVGER